MIQEIKVKNFLSFKDEVTFSFEATKDTFAEDYQVVEVAKGVRLLRFAMIYGANASGKSNLLDALRFLYYFWFEIPEKADSATGAIPFKLDSITPNEPSRFELIFYVENTKYWYQLELDSKQIYSEKLFYYKSVQPTLLFERKLQDGISVISFSPSLRISQTTKEKISLECLRNMSFFAAREQVNVSIPLIDNALDWMKYQILQPINPRTNLFKYAEKHTKENEVLRAHIMDFLREADFNITDIVTEDITQPASERVTNMFLQANEELKINEDVLKATLANIPSLKTDFEHTVVNNGNTEKYLLPQQSESLGTRRTFGIETAIYNALQRNAVLVIDEIETSLHPQLLKFILLQYLKQTNSRAQLLVATHYDPLLNEINEIFRKDSVWFTEKQENGHTDVYSLVEFRGLNKLSSIQKAYNYGNFGAYPQIDL